MATSLETLKARAQELVKKTTRLRDSLPREPSAALEELLTLQVELELQADELRRTELEAEQARRRYEELFAHVPVGVVVLDRAGVVTEANDAARRLLLTQHLRETTFRDYVAVVDQATFDHGVASAQEGPAEAELTLKPLHGGRIVARLRFRPLGQELLVSMTDVTGLRLAEREARAQAAQTRALFDSSRDGLLVVDELSRRVIDAGASFATLSGRSPEALRGMAVHELFPSFTGPLEWLRLQQHLDGAAELDAVALERPHDQPVSCELTASRVNVEGVAAVLLVVRDASARRELEAQKASLTEVMHQQQKFDALGRLAAGIAHDVNNVLAVIVAGASTLQPREGADAAAVADVLEAAARAGEMTRSLLTVARSAPAQSSHFSLSELTRSAVRLLQRSLPPGVRLTHAVADGVIVKGDAAQWHRVLSNLVSNAADALAGTGTIEVTLERVEGAAVLSVEDDGPGMPEHTRARATEPFFTTKAFGKGTGLGLALVRGVVESHEGSLALESAPGEGTRVRCSIPLVEGVDVSAPGAAPAAATQHRVLIVDDDAQLARSLQRVLQRSGFQVETAPSGPAALVALETASFDVVLTDLMMPEMNGAQLCRTLKQRYPTLPVVGMTGFAATELHEELKAAGAARVLEKPCSAAALQQALEAAIGESLTKGVR